MKGDSKTIRPRENDESLLEYYLSESNQGKRFSGGTKQGYRTAWNNYQNWMDNNNIEISNFNEKKAREYKQYLSNEYGGETPEHYFLRISIVINWLTETEEADFNPFEGVHPPKSDTETSKIEVDLDRLRKAVQNARSQSIVLFVYLMIALKTGLRSSEIVNLDLRDIHLDHPISEEMPSPRQEVYNHPDTLYVDSTITKDEEYNGEKRANSNKKRSTRRIPIDQELKSVLVWWIAMLPPSKSPADPLMRKVNDPDGERYTKYPLGQRVKHWARRNDFNDIDMKHFGVDSHWCRHWFSTMLRARIDHEEVPVGTPTGYVEGLRGDSDDRVIETYTHEWAEAEGDKSYREVYEDNIPQLLVDTEDQQQ